MPAALKEIHPGRRLQKHPQRKLRPEHVLFFLFCGGKTLLGLLIPPFLCVFSFSASSPFFLRGVKKYNYLLRRCLLDVQGFAFFFWFCPMFCFLGNKRDLAPRQLLIISAFEDNNTNEMCFFH